MVLKIGQIPYLNSVLFYHALGRRDPAAAGGGHAIELLPLVPRQLTGAVVEGRVDAGPVPVVTCWDVEDRYEPLGDFCISSVAKAYSILFFSKRPFEELGGSRIGVTGETSTSVRLLKVLLEHVYGVRSAEFAHLDWPRNDAFLLIGDEALLHRRGVDGYPHVADLGEVWNTWTGLPFVFARWVVRRDLDDASKAAIVSMVSDSLESGWRQVDSIVAPHGSGIGMDVAEMRAYLESLRFRMTGDEHLAIERFRGLDASMRRAGAASTR
jgi:chorismate dehydratase